MKTCDRQAVRRTHLQQKLRRIDFHRLIGVLEAACAARSRPAAATTILCTLLSYQLNASALNKSTLPEIT